MSHEATPLHYRDVSKETPCTGCPDCDGTRHAVAGHGCVSMAEPLPAMLDELVENASLDQLQDAHATLAEPDAPQDAQQSALETLCGLLKDSGATPVINGVKIVPRPQKVETFGGDCYRPVEVDEYITLLEARVQLHNDSAVEAWQLTQKWQKRVFELESKIAYDPTRAPVEGGQSMAEPLEQGEALKEETSLVMRLHIGDPCVFCGINADNVASGECTRNVITDERLDEIHADVRESCLSRTEARLMVQAYRLLRDSPYTAMAKPIDVCNYDAPMTHHGPTSTLGLNPSNLRHPSR